MYGRRNGTIFFWNSSYNILRYISGMILFMVKLCSTNEEVFSVFVGGSSLGSSHFCSSCEWWSLRCAFKLQGRAKRLWHNLQICGLSPVIYFGFFFTLTTLLYIWWLYLYATYNDFLNWFAYWNRENILNIDMASIHYVRTYVIVDLQVLEMILCTSCIYVVWSMVYQKLIIKYCTQQIF